MSTGSLYCRISGYKRMITLTFVITIHHPTTKCGFAGIQHD
ncbi:hypothetical protein ACFLYS_00385 [Chloroflexota bacterium]